MSVETPSTSATAEQVDAFGGRPRIFAASPRAAWARVDVHYRKAIPFDGRVISLRAAFPTEDPQSIARHVLMAEGYREQADEALGFAESTLAAAVEVLPDGE